MARWILVEIEDNEAADAYVESLQHNPAFVTVPDRMSGDQQLYKVVETQVTPVGVFGKPTKFCNCEGQDQKAAAIKGSKYGWRVCPKGHALRGSQEIRNLMDPVDAKPLDKPFFLMARNLGKD